MEFSNSPGFVLGLSAAIDSNLRYLSVIVEAEFEFNIFLKCVIKQSFICFLKSRAK